MSTTALGPSLPFCASEHLHKGKGSARYGIGTPQRPAETIADRMQEWFENGAADCFNVMTPALPQSLNEFAELVVPELQRRGLFCTAYERTTLRENLGLSRPASRYATLLAKAA